MTVRQFNGITDNITTAIGNLADLRDGDLTIAAIVKLTDTADAGIVEFHNASGIRCGLVHGSTIPIGLQDDGGGAFVGPPPNLVANVWCMSAITRLAGTIRAHIYNYDTDSWEHTDGVTVTPADDTLTSVKLGGAIFGFFGGRIAVAGAQVGIAHSNAGIETLKTSLANWQSLFTGNAAIWPHNQTSIADPVLDLVGTAHQTAIDGTTVVTGDDPPGFVFEPPVVPDLTPLLRSSAYGRRILLKAAK